MISDWQYVASGIVLVAAVMALQQAGIPSTTTGPGSVAVTVDDGQQVLQDTVTLRNSTTAFDALNRTATVNYTAYSFGYFVTGIGDVQQNATHNWIYLVNGTPASTAANRLVLASGANVTFQFMDRNASAELLE